MTGEIALDGSIEAARAQPRHTARPGRHMLMRSKLLAAAMAVALALLAVKIGGAGLGSASLLGSAVAAGEEGAPTEDPAGDADPMAVQAEVAPIADFSTVSPAEIELLESLSARREELEARARDLDMREKLLATAELRIDAKIVSLKTIQASIADSIEQFNEREDAKIKSLVKIYEKMKAKDAARIFNQLDESVLLSVVERMREAKVAEIIAQMNGDTAKAVTTSLARRRALLSVEEPRSTGN